MLVSQEKLSDLALLGYLLEWACKDD